MRQAGLLVGSFLLTITVLSGGFFVLQAGSPPAPLSAATATPVPSATATPRVTARPMSAPTSSPSSTSPTPGPTPSATASRSSNSPAPTRTPAPTATAAASATTGQRGDIDAVVKGSEYTNATVAQTGSLTTGPDGSVTFRTDRMHSDQTEVDWELPRSVLPAGARIVSIDVSVCGTGSGDFWESYGPEGSDPIENEVTAPDPDGCWHYDGAPGPDTTVKAFIRLGSTMTISRIEYRITLA